MLNGKPAEEMVFTFAFECKVFSKVPAFVVAP